MRRGMLLALAGCWSAATPPPPPPPAVEVGAFDIVFDRAGRCDDYAVEHAGKVHACHHAWDARTGLYAGRGRVVIGFAGEHEIAASARDGFDVDGKQIETRHIYKPALSPDGKHLAYLVEHFTPDYHQTIAVRETTRWTIEYEVPQPKAPGESFHAALGWLGERLYVAVASPTCIGLDPCSQARLAEVGPRGVASGPDHAASYIAFAPDGSAVAIADRESVRIWAPGMPLEGPAMAQLMLAAKHLPASELRELAVAPAGKVLAINNFSERGLVVFERRDRGFAETGTFPGLIGTKLIFSRAGDALFASGTTLAVLRRTITPARTELPPLTLDATGFAVEDCADPRPTGFYCNTDHQLRLRLETPQPAGVRVEVHVSPINELPPTATLAAWTALLRDRFEFTDRDIKEHVDLGLRAWQAADGRQLELHHQIRESCQPADAFTRIAERAGWLWRITVYAPPDAPQTVVDPLLARMIDSWLGPPAQRIARTMPAPSGTTQCATF